MKVIPAHERKLTVKERSKLHEQHIAETLRGRVQPGSGASDYAKGDVRTRRFLVECKLTGKASYALAYDTLAKIDQQASSMGKDPALALTFECAKANSWVIIPMRVFKELFDE